MADHERGYGLRWGSKIKKWRNSILGIASEVSLVIAISLIALLIMIIVRAIVI